MAKKTEVVREAENIDISGRITRLPPQIQVDFESGTQLIAPGNARFALGVIDDIEKGLDILCRVFGWGCPKPSPGGSGGSSGCIIIRTPDGTTITICPPTTAILA